MGYPSDDDFRAAHERPGPPRRSPPRIELARSFRARALARLERICSHTAAAGTRNMLPCDYRCYKGDEDALTILRLSDDLIDVYEKARALTRHLEA
jgi:hypothetical protein